MNGDAHDPGEHPLNALTEQTAPEKPKIPGRERAVRTLEGDIQEAVEEKNASAVSISIAEQAKDRAASQKRERRSSGFLKKLAIVILCLALILIGAGGGYYLYLKSPLAPTPPAPTAAPVLQAIVTPDVQEDLDLSAGLSQSATKAAVASALSKDVGAAGSIVQIIPFLKTTAGNSLMDGPDFLDLAGIGVPDVLLRSLGDSWMLGTYADGGTSAPFIIVTDDFFQNAYAGMIAWEPSMADDLQPIFGYDSSAMPAASTAPSALATTSTAMSTATSTATSTVSTTETTGSAPDISSYFSIQGNWADGVIQNKDVRVFSRPDGSIVLLYSFVDNDTIVITTDENALAEIIDRLEQQTFVR